MKTVPIATNGSQLELIIRAIFRMNEQLGLNGLQSIFPPPTGGLHTVFCANSNGVPPIRQGRLGASARSGRCNLCNIWQKQEESSAQEWITHQFV